MVFQKGNRLGRKIQKGHTTTKGDKNGRWKGGINLHDSGYILKWQPNHPNCDRHGYVFEHRLVMEQYLRRYLEPNEVVHHINGDKQDNRIENLQLMNKSEHMSYHSIERHVKLGHNIRN